MDKKAEKVSPIKSVKIKIKFAKILEKAKKK